MDQREQEIARLAGLAGGVKDRAGIVFQDLQPVGEIIGMADLRHDVQMRAKKGAGQFGNQFFARIGGGTETVLQIAIEARRMRSPVAKFVKAVQ